MPSVSSEQLISLSAQTGINYSWKSMLQDIRDCNAKQIPDMSPVRGDIKAAAPIVLLDGQLEKHPNIPTITLSAAEGSYPTIDVNTWVLLGVPVVADLQVVLGHGWSKRAHTKSDSCKGCRLAFKMNYYYTQVLAGRKISLCLKEVKVQKEPEKIEHTVRKRILKALGASGKS